MDGRRLCPAHLGTLSGSQRLKPEKKRNRSEPAKDRPSFVIQQPPPRKSALLKKGATEVALVFPVKAAPAGVSQHPHPRARVRGALTTLAGRQGRAAATGDTSSGEDRRRVYFFASGESSSHSLGPLPPNLPVPFRACFGAANWDVPGWDWAGILISRVEGALDRQLAASP